MDARVVVAVTGRGRARSRQLVDEFKRLAQLVWQADPPLVVAGIHVPRDQNVDADALSRVNLLSDSALRPSLLEELCRWAFRQDRPDVDLFADWSNAVADAFWTRWPTPGAAGADGLTAPLLPRSYLFPPFSLSRQAFAKFCQFREAGVSALFVGPRQRLTAVLALVPGCDMRVIPAGAEVICPPPYDRCIASSEQLIAVRSAAAGR